jgi:hypothetical protein
MNSNLKLSFLVIIILVFVINSYVQSYPLKDQSTYEVYKNISAAIHIQSDISDGQYSFAQIVKIAKEKNIKVLIFTDTALRRWEYGIRPLENIVKKRIEQGSVFRFGIGNYLNALEDVQKNNPDVIIIPAVEVVPFYYWEGNFLNKGLTLHNWHKQLIVIGLRNEKDYRYLPIIANYSLLPLHRRNLQRLWPLMFIFLGILVIIFSSNRRNSRRWGWIFLIIGGVFLINNLRFNISRFDAYHGDQKTKPYQDLINYVNNKGGLVFWVHPEVENIDRVIGVNVSTPAYKNDLLYTYNYTGSAVLFDDNRSLARAGEIWDKILLDYCRGRRMQPVWAIATIDYHGDKQDISKLQTILLLQDLNEMEVMRALKNGRMYTKLNNQPNDFSLDRFVISDSKKENFGLMGDNIQINSKPEIIIETSCSIFADEPIEINLIRNGELIKTFNPESSNFQVRYQDDYFILGEKIFYRLMIKSKKNLYRIISNPIFVKFVSK